MFQLFPLRVLEVAINTGLSLDKISLLSLSQFEGKVLKVFVTPFQLAFFMTFSSKGITLHLDEPGLPDAAIYSSPIGLIRLSVLPASQSRSLFHDGVRIEGDVLFAESVKKVIDGLNIDWEAHIARFTGDVVAYHLGQGVRSLKARYSAAKDASVFALGSYLKEEVKCFPSKLAVEDFLSEVDELALEVERIEAKIKQGTQGLC